MTALIRVCDGGHVFAKSRINVIINPNGLAPKRMTVPRSVFFDPFWITIGHKI
jgi:hypothetical protein